MAPLKMHDVFMAILGHFQKFIFVEKAMKRKSLKAGSLLQSANSLPSGLERMGIMRTLVPGDMRELPSFRDEGGSTGTENSGPSAKASSAGLGRLSSWVQL